MANENIAFDIVPEKVLDELNVKQLDSLYDEVARRLDHNKPPIEIEKGLRPGDESVSVHLSYDTYLDIMSRRGEYERELQSQQNFYDNKIKKITNEANQKLRVQRRLSSFCVGLALGTGIMFGFKTAWDNAEDLKAMREEMRRERRRKKEDPDVEYVDKTDKGA